MHRLLVVIMLAASMSLSACVSIPTSPRVVAQMTKIDEQALLTAESSYAAFRTAVLVAAKSKLLSPSQRFTLRALNRKLYGGLQVLEDAYKTGNAPGFASGLQAFKQTLADAKALTQGTQ